MSADALRADRLGCYGYERADTSPTIDAWAKQAVLFEHAYAQAPWTVPSLASLMGGLYPREVGAHTNLFGDINRRVQTLAERLRSLGYQTAFFNTNPLLAGRPGLARGFDTIVPEAVFQEKIPYSTVEPLLMEWLDQHAAGKFFLWIHDMDAHMPPTAGNPYRDQPDWDAYDADVRWVDEAVHRLLLKLDALGIRDRVALLFTADHGESFGEHGLPDHQDVIYDEVLHVPLIVQFPGMAATGRVAEPVALLDANPTIVQLAGGAPMGDTPRGSSLVPVLAATHHAAVSDRYVFSSRYYFGIDRTDPSTGKLLTERGTHHLAVHTRDWALIAKVRATTLPSSNDDGVEGDTSEEPDWRDEGATYELYNLATDPLEEHDVFPEKGDRRIASELQWALAAWKRLTDGADRIRTLQKVETVTLDSASREALDALGYKGN